MSTHDNTEIELFAMPGGSEVPLLERLRYPDGSFRNLEFGETTRNRIFDTYNRFASISRKEFDFHWPNIVPLKMPATIVVASIDSGILLDHPMLSTQIVASSDYTGEGPQDDVGHGTLTAILSMLSQPFDVKIVNIKVIGRSGRGRREDLINALGSLPDLARELRERFGVPQIEAHLRCGQYSWRTLGLRECNGTCDICEAAISAAENGVTIQAAVGNIAHRTACPATAKIKRDVPGIQILSQPGAIDFAPSELA